MDIMAFIIEAAQDADPLEKGYQAKGIYVAMSILVPIAIGVLTNIIVGVVETLTGIKFARGEH